MKLPAGNLESVTAFGPASHNCTAHEAVRMKGAIVVE